MLEHRLTTVDNPFDPFDEWDSWLLFDHKQEHYTNELLARVCISSDELSELDQNIAIEQAIDDIISVDLFDKYRKVSRESVENVVNS